MGAWRDESRPAGEWPYLKGVNVGVDCGKAGLVVLDEDEPGALDLLDLPETFLVKTGGGRHAYFRANGVMIKNKTQAWPGIDVRAEGGYVVGPGSTHENGTIYEVLDSRDPAPLPAHIERQLADEPISSGGGEIEIDLTGYRERFELPDVIREGERNETLFRYACSLVGRGVRDHEALTLLKDAYDRCDAPYRDESPERMLKRATREYGAAQGGDNGARRVRVTWAESIEPEPVVWAWTDDQGQGRIPAGTLAIAAGREGTGKSSFGMWLAAQITTGKLPGNFHGKPRRVLYVAVEDSWKHTLVPRLLAAGADLSKIGRLDVVADDGEELTMSLPADNGALETAIRDHDVALVVLDPLMSAIAGKIDTHREREVRSALDPLAKIADRTGAIVLGIAHFNKGSGSDAANLITGSGAFKNVPRSVFGFARDDGDGSRVMTQVKNSLGRDDLASLGYRIEAATIPTAKGPAETSRLVWTGVSDKSVADVLRDARMDDHDERHDAASWLVEFLTEQGGSASSKEVFKAGRDAGGWSPQALRRARGARVQSVKSGMSGGWDWCLTGAEGDTKITKVTGNSTPASSSPSASPSGFSATADGPILTIEYGENHV